MQLLGIACSERKVGALRRSCTHWRGSPGTLAVSGIRMQDNQCNLDTSDVSKRERGISTVFRAAADFANIEGNAQFHLAHTRLRWL